MATFQHVAVFCCIYPWLWIHDFRRSATRNMTRAGVPDDVSMKFTGHKTSIMFRRYNIIDEEPLRDAAQAMQAFADSPRGKGQVVDFKEGLKNGSK